MIVIWMGQIDYMAGLEAQTQIAELRKANQIDDTLLLMECSPTITVGRGAKPGHILSSQEELAKMGIKLVNVDRGGDVTYHGPGQLVGYPVFNLEEHGRDLHAFLRRIEGSIINLLDSFGITGRRFPPHTGVWVADKKISAIGIKVSHWVSTHGFSINVNPNMAHFGRIVPCGIYDYGVTSILEETGKLPVLRSVVDLTAKAFRDEFDTGSLGSTQCEAPETLRGLGECL